MYNFRKVFKRKNISRNDKLGIIKRDKLACIQCNRKLALRILNRNYISIEDGIFHHIIPMVYGGENKTYNVCLLCVQCHNKIHSGKETKEKYIIMFEKYIHEGRLV